MEHKETIEGLHSSYTGILEGLYRNDIGSYVHYVIVIWELYRIT